MNPTIRNIGPQVRISLYDQGCAVPRGAAPTAQLRISFLLGLRSIFRQGLKNRIETMILAGKFYESMTDAIGVKLSGSTDQMHAELVKMLARRFQLVPNRSETVFLKKLIAGNLPIFLSFNSAGSIQSAEGVSGAFRQLVASIEKLLVLPPKQSPKPSAVAQMAHELSQHVPRKA